MELTEGKEPTLQASLNCGRTSTGSRGGAATPSYVCAIGRIEPRFLRLSVQKELTRATAQADTGGLSDRQALQKILSEGGNRYLARRMCWVLNHSQLFSVK